MNLVELWENDEIPGSVQAKCSACDWTGTVQFNPAAAAVEAGDHRDMHVAQAEAEAKNKK